MSPSAASAAQASRPDGEPAIEREAFTRFHDRNAQALRSYLRRFTGDPEMAEDVVQDAFVRFLVRGPGTDEQVDRAIDDPGIERRLRAWLFRTATRLVYDRWRRRKVEHRHLASLPDREPSVPGTPRFDLGSDLGRAFARLQERQRALQWLAHVEECSHQEIATILGLRTLSVKVLLHRARKKMSATLDEIGWSASPVSSPHETSADARLESAMPSNLHERAGSP